MAAITHSTWVRPEPFSVMDTHLTCLKRVSGTNIQVTVVMAVCGHANSKY